MYIYIDVYIYIYIHILQYFHSYNQSIIVTQMTIEDEIKIIIKNKLKKRSYLSVNQTFASQNFY